MPRYCGEVCSVFVLFSFVDVLRAQTTADELVQQFLKKLALAKLKVPPVCVARRRVCCLVLVSILFSFSFPFCVAKGEYQIQATVGGERQTRLLREVRSDVCAQATCINLRRRSGR